MKEGYWANYETRQVLQIHEHERWMREAGNPELLGIPIVFMEKAIAQYREQTDRNAFLKRIMECYPVMRIRGHGDSVTFEFDEEHTQDSLKLIHHLGQEWFAPSTLLKIHNFASNTSTWFRWEEMSTPDGRLALCDSCRKSSDMGRQAGDSKDGSRLPF